MFRLLLSTRTHCAMNPKLCCAAQSPPPPPPTGSKHSVFGAVCPQINTETHLKKKEVRLKAGFEITAPTTPSICDDSSSLQFSCDVNISSLAVAHAQDTHHHSAEKPLIQCYKCGEPCKGEVLRVQNKHFHLKCFTCKGNTANIRR